MIFRENFAALIADDLRQAFLDMLFYGHGYCRIPLNPNSPKTMAKAQLFWDSSIQAYRLKMHAEWNKVEKIVEFLKQHIPHSDRELKVDVDPKTQKKDYTWTFTEKYFDGTVKFLELVFGKPEIAIITRQQVEAAQQPRMNIVPNGNPLFAACYEFLKAIPFESAQKAYRDAALRLHPDRGGSMDKMASVNALWTKLEKELYQQ